MAVLLLQYDINQMRECTMVAKTQIKTESKKAGRKVFDKDGLIGMNLISTEKNKLIQNIKKGLPISAFEKIQKELDVSADTLASAVNIASRTLARRKKEGRFQPDESERVLRIASLFDRALQVLHNQNRVKIWFKSPQKALGGKTPLEYADTEPGAREVEDLLGRLEHGVFS
jgi:putative toxin-antitoxin system antitoxin component (TIGR02293 family)